MCGAGICNIQKFWNLVCFVIILHYIISPIFRALGEVLSKIEKFEVRFHSRSIVFHGYIFLRSQGTQTQNLTPIDLQLPTLPASMNKSQSIIRNRNLFGRCQIDRFDDGSLLSRYGNFLFRNFRLLLLLEVLNGLLNLWGRLLEEDGRWAEASDSEVVVTSENIGASKDGDR